MTLKATPTVDLEPTAFEAAEIAEETMAGMQAEIDRLTAESARLQSLIGSLGGAIRRVDLDYHFSKITPEGAAEIRVYIDAEEAKHD